jgi:hypothetical protein
MVIQGSDHPQPPSRRIRDLIAQLGVSQRVAAQELGVDSRTMRYWCADDGKVLTPRMAILALERLVDLTIRFEARIS